MYLTDHTVFLECARLGYGILNLNVCLGYILHADDCILGRYGLMRS